MDILKSFDWFKIGLVVLVLFLTSTLFSKCENEKVQLATIKALTEENTSYKLKNNQLNLVLSLHSNTKNRKSLPLIVYL